MDTATHTELRITYTDRRGACCMRTTTWDTLAADLEKLHRRGINAEAHEYQDGRRGRLVGEVFEPYDERGRIWWCE